jgi:diguanylate cyclase (GGDEF)-like protein
LKVVASRLAHSLRTGDLLVRYGGDEFVVLIEHVADQAEATGLAERILCALKTPIRVGSDDIDVSASVGIAISNRPEANPIELLSRADQGMYRAKALGRNRQYIAAADAPSQFAR